MTESHRAAPHRGRTPIHLRRPGSILLALVAALGLLLGIALTAPAAEAAPNRPKVPAKAADAVAAMQPSWNLGNSLDAIPDETSWGNPPATKALFDTIHAQGYRSVRIPVTWTDHQSATAPYTIDAAFLSRVKQVVDWALADGLYVVLNVHHDSWQWIAKMSTDHDNVLARFDSSWTQISSTFKDEPRTLLFESVNEPQFDNATDAQKTRMLDELNVSFHEIVRASGGQNTSRLLVLPTQGCTPSQPLMDDLYATISKLNDPGLIATVHYYSYYPFSVNIANGTRYDDAAQKDLTDAFARMHDTFVAKGVPVYLGEYGLLSYPDNNHPDRIERGEALKYFEQVGYAARQAGVTTALWDPFAYLNRATLQWRDQELFDWIKASGTNRSGSMSFDRVFVPKSGAITDQSLTLNLNGLSFQGLWQGDSKLAEGTDYTVSGDRLTLTATALTRLVGDRSYGDNSTLQARFSQGLPWKIHVTTYDTPQQSGATGNTTSLVVPTQFRGDQLATMESTYADGSNAGPADWTAFQEFNLNFTPDYAGNTITLTDTFLGSLRDNAPVTLAFHFYSGAKITYHVTRTGTSVTGSAG
ncbi:cellulase family glycosylhydrolase [Streptomyces sp. CBMA29]|uniref:cellulase family glycosylhydrolase n=1 Tax=Streptomyces sp. CBMA29 TaxID=1896314 RepID=UPI0016619E3A|nr:cellulase family glycosylhydrolase [Streptomyces sp. CBMA29]MBD0734907.1 cellulase [Streptomyces sp. CBMA29]